MIEQWLAEVKRQAPPEGLGMILVHNGVVRATSKTGQGVTGMRLSYDHEALAQARERYLRQDGIADIRVWINEGALGIGDDIMLLLVAGRFRTDILPVFQEFLTEIKTKIVKEEEL